MPETKPGIFFNEDGICNACINAEKKDESIDWDIRMAELIEIANKVKSQKPQDYNCLIPVSGGKDSTFMAMFIRDKLGLTPLCVYVEPCYITKRGELNIRNLSKLGFDIFRFMPNQKIMPMLLKKSFIEDGQPVRAFEFMLYSVPMQVAINYKIPLVIWGENPQFKYGNVGGAGDASAAGQKECAAIAGQNAEHWIGEGILKKDLIAFQHPTENELITKGVMSIYLSYYVKWDSREIAKFAIKHGLTIRSECELGGTGGYWNFEQLDDEIPIISHLLKFLKFGYGRATDQACRDIRNGFLTREEGLKLAKEYDGQIDPEYIRNYCNYIGISIKEFWDIAKTFSIKNDIMRF